MAKAKPISYFQRRRKPFGAAALAISLAAAAAGCAERDKPGGDFDRLGAASAAPMPANARAFARFTAPAAAGSQSPAQLQAAERAAALAAPRNYPYFILIQQPAAAAEAAQSSSPKLGITYGRQPYGFGDADGQSGPPGLGIMVSPALLTALLPKKNSAAPAQWLVYMLKAPSRQAALAAFAGGAAPADTVLVYKSRAPAAPPIILRLR